MMLFIVFVGLFIGGSARLIYDCPNGWYTNNGFCYLFVNDVIDTYDGARANCDRLGSGVLSIDNLAENTFISNWLNQNDPFQQEWYTSGIWSEEATSYIWESTGQPLDPGVTGLWIQTPETAIERGVIIYTLGINGYGWLYKTQDVKRPYICKISEAEAYRILLTERDYDYGVVGADLNALDYGPHFDLQPNSVVVVNDVTLNSEPIILQCVVRARPVATYKWFRGDNYEIDLGSSPDPRITITNGKLTIQRPREDLDAGKYRCEAENKYGRVLSDFVEVSFGQLGEFNNVPDAGTRVKAYEGAQVVCSKIIYKPAVSYQWIKGDSQQFVRPQFQDYIFISNNGKLYFSEVSRADEATYKCVAMLKGVNRYTIGTYQPPMRVSLPIPLVVQDQSPLADWGPKIQNDFIAVFPTPPIRGQDVSLECFAYGSTTSPFIYQWSREDKPMPERAEFQDHNRVLFIRDAQLEDSGTYRCTVSRGTQARDTKTVDLQLSARPYFVSPLKDQHVDINSQLTWICNARGQPKPVYRWYKNGVPLTADEETRVKIVKNVLVINDLDPKIHNGMYQCGAENTFGMSLSEAELRVLAFAPIVSKRPPPPNIIAPLGGNITLRCQPEGAPFPNIEWLKGGNPVQNDGSKYTIFANGNLHITALGSSDGGRYTCKASNEYGEAEVSTTVSITRGASLTLLPTDDRVRVNESVFLPCEASRSNDIDMVYVWTFNDFPIDFNRENYYSQRVSGPPGTLGLYLRNAQFEHEGQYTCTAKTVFNHVSAGAYLQVRGPPKEPAGVIVPADTVTQTTAVVMWTQGSGSGGTISAHVIQVANEFRPDEWNDLTTVEVAETVDTDDVVGDKHAHEVTGLNPGTGYKFRLFALNEYGRGLPSSASTYVRTISAPPTVVPRNVGGGGGSVGDLTIRWDPLDRSEWGSGTVGYKVYWRRLIEGNRQALWESREVSDPYQGKYVTLVGAELYFLPYETMVQAYNSQGYGPNSSVEVIYSAEELPLASPLNVNTNTFNSTAIEVFWDPVPETRLAVRGIIKGYQINYWNEEDDPDDFMQSIRYYGQLDYGLVIGLEVDVNMVIDVQVYNSAGLGPRSNQYIMETSGYAPLHYPQEVRITSAGPYRAHIWWRGITITVEEEAITGYAIWLWTASEDFRAAELIEIEGIVFEYVLDDLEKGRLYAMRIAAIGGGGYGAKTPTVYFTTEGEIIIDHSLAQTIDVFLSAATKPKVHLISLMGVLSISLFWLFL